MNTYLRFPELAATAAHIERVQSKIDRLNEAKQDSWQQVLTAAARVYREGRMSLVELQQLADQMAFWYGTGYTKVWDAIMPIRAVAIRHLIDRERRDSPNGPMGSWEGEMRAAGKPKPWAGLSVVYVLFDANNEPVYVGSTGHFPMRLAAHRKNKPAAVRWTAYRCRDREDAYQMEERLLHEHMPAMNKRRGR